jgi:hypothetical protein
MGCAPNTRIIRGQSPFSCCCESSSILNNHMILCDFKLSQTVTVLISFPLPGVPRRPLRPLVSRSDHRLRQTHPLSALANNRDIHRKLLNSPNKDKENAESSRVAGLGIRHKGHPARSRLVGTVDDDFINGRTWVPKDFDFSVWNAAWPDQQTPHLHGDETIELTNL